MSTLPDIFRSFDKIRVQKSKPRRQGGIFTIKLK